ERLLPRAIPRPLTACRHGPRSPRPRGDDLPALRAPPRAVVARRAGAAELGGRLLARRVLDPRACACLRGRASDRPVGRGRADPGRPYPAPGHGQLRLYPPGDRAFAARHHPGADHGCSHPRRLRDWRSL
ncbi:MAG: hypothetical protein AVDCRST_MAG15-3293, partial [uncultured Rubellimicrobium sp.]